MQSKFGNRNGNINQGFANGNVNGNANAGFGFNGNSNGNANGNFARPQANFNIESNRPAATTQTEVTVRKIFPESWLWSDITTA